MPADAAAADGEHFTADPLGRRRSRGVPDTVDFCNRLAGRWYMVRPSRIFIGIVTSGRPLDRHRIKLRQVNLKYFVFLTSLFNIRIRRCIQYELKAFG